MTPSVLIVASSLTVRMDIAEAFEAIGARPFPCATLTDAQQILARHAVDLSVLDVGQTDADGATLAAEGRKLLAALAPLLFLFSGEVPPSHSRATTRREFWIQKPYNTEQVVTQARLLLSTHATRGDSSPLVLLIDDSLTFRTEMERVLNEHGFLVETAATGEAGLKLLTQLRPAAVIVDGVLPGIDGVTVIRRVRLDPSLRGVPCVLLTAAQDTEAELKALDSGADAFARKDEDAAVLIARVQAVIRAAPTSDGAAKSGLPSPRKILAVDDSPTYRSKLADSLEEEGYQVLQASSGEEAIELLSKQPVDCVLLDLMMPGIGGKETCRQIKGSPLVRNIPVLLLTGVEERDAMLEGLALGADDYIPKSAEFEVLKARLRVQLRRSQFEDESRRVREQQLRSEFEAAEARAARELAHTRALLVDELEEKNAALKHAYEELKSAQAQLIQSAKMASLGGLVAGVAHEINNPLSFVISHLETIERCLDRLPGEAGAQVTVGHLQQRQRARDRLRETTLGVERMRDLVIKLRTFSRLDEGERKVVSFKECVSSLLTMLGHKFGERIAVQVQLGEPDLLDCYPSLLNQALMNLVSNAIDAIENEGTISIRSEWLEGQFTIVISDTGTGIPEALKERVLEPFFTTKPVGQGTGLGLSITYAIVRRHGGTLELGSGPNGGTQATIHIPVSN